MPFFFKENIMNASKKALKNDFITYHIRTFIEKVYV